MTPHIEAIKSDIAKKVLMPGDPLRAKFIALNYLTDYKLVNNVRGMLAYTGFYNDKRVTVMASGMGMASIGIYSYELFKFYDVDEIIRIGSCGSYTSNLELNDVILVSQSYSESTYNQCQNGSCTNIISANKELNEKIIEVAKTNNIRITSGIIHSSDVFYSDIVDINDLFYNKNCLGVEMESFALFHNAKTLNKKATCLLTVTDNIITGKKASSEERQNSLTTMIELALKSL